MAITKRYIHTIAGGFNKRESLVTIANTLKLTGKYPLLVFERCEEHKYIKHRLIDVKRGELVLCQLVRLDGLLGSFFSKARRES